MFYMKNIIHKTNCMHALHSLYAAYKKRQGREKYAALIVLSIQFVFKATFY